MHQTLNYSQQEMLSALGFYTLIDEKEVTQTAVNCIPNSRSGFLSHTYQQTEIGLMRHENMKYKNTGLTSFHMYFSHLESNAKESYNFSSC